MEGFTILDGGVALLIIVSALLAYGRGLVRELLAIVGWVGAAVVGYMFAPKLEPLVRDAPVVGEFVSGNCELSMVVAFFAIVVAALIVFSLFTPLFSSVIQRSVLGGIDQALGFLFGIARGILLVAIGFFIYETVVPDQELTIVDDSRSSKVFEQFTDKIQEQDPKSALGWVTDKFNTLVNSCE